MNDVKNRGMTMRIAVVPLSWSINSANGAVGGGTNMNKEQAVIEAAKDVDRIWRNDGPHVPHFSTALALLSRSISKLRLYREGRREEVGHEL